MQWRYQIFAAAYGGLLLQSHSHQTAICNSFTPLAVVEQYTNRLPTLQNHLIRLRAYLPSLAYSDW